MVLGSSRQEGQRRQKLKPNNSQTIVVSTGWNWAGLLDKVKIQTQKTKSLLAIPGESLLLLI